MARVLVMGQFIICVTVLIVEASTKKIANKRCVQTFKEKRDCGYYGIQEPECLSRRCCWQPPSKVNEPWCFRPKKKPKPKKICEGKSGYKNSCYKVWPTLGTWQESEEDCLKQGGHLVDISDADEMKHVSSLLKDWSDETLVWIGLNDQVTEGTFVWLNSSSLSTNYMNWRSREPNDWWGDDDCVAAMASPYSHLLGKWYDLPCTHNLPYVCKTPPSNSSTN